MDLQVQALGTQFGGRTTTRISEEINLGIQGLKIQVGQRSPRHGRALHRLVRRDLTSAIGTSPQATGRQARIAVGCHTCVALRRTGPGPDSGTGLPAQGLRGSVPGPSQGMRPEGAGISCPFSQLTVAHPVRGIVRGITCAPKSKRHPGIQPGAVRDLGTLHQLTAAAVWSVNDAPPPYPCPRVYGARFCFPAKLGG